MSKSESLDFLNVKSLNKNRSTPSIDVFKSQEKPRNQRSTSSGLIANSNFDGSVLGKLENDNFNKSANSTRREYSMKRKPVKLDRIQSNRTSPSPDFSHSFMLQPKVVEAQDLYKSCISRSPYEQPAEKYSASEIISKEAAKNEFSKLNLRFEKMKKILNNQDFPTLGDMIAGVETAGKVFCDCD